MNTPVKIFASFAISLTFAAASVAQTNAEGAPTATPPVVMDPPSAGAISVDELGAFIDGVVKAYQAKEGIAGVTVSVVDRDRLLFARGYGVASTNPPRPVDPARTLFRIGSVSKPFTYIAALQLVEEGRLRLDDDANKYLPSKLQLPADVMGPVKVWHLMTHTAGFEDSALGHLFFKSGEGLPALDDYLARYRPKRVRPPGQHAVYSNYSVALLGALVAHVSGEPFESYVEKHILQPLGMNRTTFREPVPEPDPRRMSLELQQDLSTGFQRKAGGFEAKDVEYIGASAPAGAASSTAEDMARFLRMLLNGGSLDGKTILQPDTFALLAQVNFRNGDAVAGIAHGFFRQHYGKFGSLEHGGATLWFHTAMVALPEANLGVFVSSNTENGREFAATLPRLIFERFVAGAIPGPPPESPRDFTTTGQKFAGAYLSERRAYSTVEKFLGGLQPPTQVAVTKDGQLVIASGPVVKRYVADGPLSFRAIDTGERIEFLADASGKITGYASAYGHVVSDKVTFLNSPQMLVLGLGAGLLAAVAVLLGWWRRSARRREDRPRSGGIAATTMILAALGWLAFFIMLAIALVQLTSGGNDVIFTYPDPVLRWATRLGLGVAALSILVLLTLPSAYFSSWSIWRKLRHTALAFVMVAAALLLWQWNFILAPLILGS